MTDLKQALEKAARDLIDQGHESIPLHGLLDYLDKYETNSRIDTANAAAELERQTEVWKIQATTEHAAHIEMFKSVIEAGQTALKSAILINGGGAVALLAFLGNAVAKFGPQINAAESGLVLSLNNALLFFFVGTGLSAFCLGLRYLSQAAYQSEWNGFGRVFTVLTIAFGFLAYGMFFTGGYFAFDAFREFANAKAR